MFDPNFGIKEILLTLLKNQKAWLIALAALFSWIFPIENQYLEIAAGLITAWIVMLLFLNKRSN